MSTEILLLGLKTDFQMMQNMLFFFLRQTVIKSTKLKTSRQALTDLPRTHLQTCQRSAVLDFWHNACQNLVFFPQSVSVGRFLSFTTEEVGVSIALRVAIAVMCIVEIPAFTSVTLLHFPWALLVIAQAKDAQVTHCLQEHTGDVCRSQTDPLCPLMKRLCYFSNNCMFQFVRRGFQGGNSKLPDNLSMSLWDCSFITLPPCPLCALSPLILFCVAKNGDEFCQMLAGKNRHHKESGNTSHKLGKDIYSSFN